MKGINNRQKMIVKPRESAQKFVLSARILKKELGRGEKQSNGRKSISRKKETR